MKNGKEGPTPNEAASRNIEPANARPSRPQSEENRTPAMVGLVIAVVLLVVGLWLARQLTAASKMQDCVMSGRTNCNVIQPQ